MKRIQHKLPSTEQNKITFLIIEKRICLFEAVCNSATVGSIIVATELVIAVGKSMQGSDIPVKTPYILND